MTEVQTALDYDEKYRFFNFLYYLAAVRKLHEAGFDISKLDYFEFDFPLYGTLGIIYTYLPYEIGHPEFFADPNELLPGWKYEDEDEDEYDNYEALSICLYLPEGFTKEFQEKVANLAFQTIDKNDCIYNIVHWNAGIKIGFDFSYQQEPISLYVAEFVIRYANLVQQESFQKGVGYDGGFYEEDFI